MKFTRLLLILISTALLLNVTFIYAKDISNDTDEVPYDETSYFKSHGALDPNDKDAVLDNYAFGYVPIIYMQDYQEITMPNGQAVSKSGNLFVCLSMLASYKKSDWITPDEFAKNFPSAFDENGNLLIDSALNEITDGHYEKCLFDYKKMAQYLASEGRPVILLRLSHPSIYGTNSTYLIITGISEDGFIAIRDPNKSNIANYSYGIAMDNSPLYHCGDIMVSTGTNSTMYVIY